MVAVRPWLPSARCTCCFATARARLTALLVQCHHARLLQPQPTDVVRARLRQLHVRVVFRHAVAVKGAQRTVVSPGHGTGPTSLCVAASTTASTSGVAAGVQVQVQVQPQLPGKPQPWRIGTVAAACGTASTGSPHSRRAATEAATAARRSTHAR